MARASLHFHARKQRFSTTKYSMAEVSMIRPFAIKISIRLHTPLLRCTARPQAEFHSSGGVHAPFIPACSLEWCVLKAPVRKRKLFEQRFAEDEIQQFLGTPDYGIGPVIFISAQVAARTTSRNRNMTNVACVRRLGRSPVHEKQFSPIGIYMARASLHTHARKQRFPTRKLSVAELSVILSFAC
jgi:hypothetical protein